MTEKFLNRKNTKAAKNLSSSNYCKIAQLVKKKLEILINFINFYDQTPLSIQRGPKNLVGFFCLYY